VTKASGSPLKTTLIIREGLMMPACRAFQQPRRGRESLVGLLRCKTQIGAHQFSSQIASLQKLGYTESIHCAVPLFVNRLN